MQKRSLVFLGVLLFSSFFFLCCGKFGGRESSERELVKINDVSLSLEEFHRLSERQSLEGKMKLLNEKGMREFLENYVIPREVLYQEAKKKGLDKKKEILAKVEDFRRAIMIDGLLEEALRGKGQVSEAEIEKYYKENPDQFTEPKEVKIRHIFVTSEPVLREVLTRISKGESFEKLASTYNIDKTREDGGSLGYIKRGQLAPSFAQFEEAAFSLREKGQISDVVKTPFGYHLIQLEDKRGAVLRPFDQVKEKIRFFLHAKKNQEAYLEFVKEAKSRAKIVIDEKLWAEEEKKEPRPKEKN